MSDLQKFDNFDDEYSSSNENDPLAQQTTNRKYIFFMFIYICMVMNFDTGVFPVAIDAIERDLSINKQEIALLGNLPFLGIFTVAIFVTYICKKLSVKRALYLALIFNIASCAMVTFSWNVALCGFGRYAQGLSQTFFSIYAPIWIVNFAPIRYKNLWVGILQGFAPLGVIVGYIITGAFLEIIPYYHIWRAGILVQGSALIPVLLFFPMIKTIQYSQRKRESIDTLKLYPVRKPTSFDMTNSMLFQQQKAHYIDAFILLADNKIYLATTFGQVCTLFISQVFLFWSTQYLTEVLGLSKVTAITCFVFMMITSPMMGLVCGGFLRDNLGGKSIRKSFQIAIICMFLGNCISNSMTYYPNAILQLIGLWTTVFINACAYPTLITTQIESIEIQYQSFSQSFSILINNLLGQFIPPMVVAAFMELGKGSQLQEMVLGLRFSLFIGNIGWVVLLFTYFFIPKRSSHDRNNSPQKDQNINSDKKLII